MQKSGRSRKKAPARKRGTVKKKAEFSASTTPRALAAAVQAALQRSAGAGPPGPEASKLDHVADALVTKACAGDVQAIKAVFERIDGKVAVEQKISDAPPSIVIVHTFKSGI